ncbi:MAG TPA: c-type cytochrome [Vicinamibacterales bacterium]|nr:c-type cytochrome [Vicinamibacterales bacterium]
MRVRAKTIVLGVLALLVVVVIGGITAIGWQVVLGPSARPVTDRKFEVTEARLARGKYIVEGPAHCFMCHTEHDLSTPTLPIIQSKLGSGWELPIPELNNPSSKNITSDRETGLGDWTDDEIARAIREGIRKDGTALFPIMPYPLFAKLDDEDVASIVVYLRTLPAIRHEVPKRNLPFPLEYIVKTIPKPITTPQPSHPSATAAERGEYMVNMAGCGECHTPANQGVPLPGMAFAGGGLFNDPSQGGKAVFSMNITPDPSGIAHYDEALLTQTLHTGEVSGRMLNHIMPFESFKNITDADIADIFAYLKTLTPVKHRISNTDPPTPCPLCKQTHGLGELNAPIK